MTTQQSASVTTARPTGNLENVPYSDDAAANLEAGPSRSGLTVELNTLGHYLGALSRGCWNEDLGNTWVKYITT